MVHDADAMVVGSGPSGVSVALPMLEAGMRVLLLDGGKERVPGLLLQGAYHEIRRDAMDQWRAFLGPGLESLRRSGPPSPKFDAPGSSFAFEDLAGGQRVDGRGFAAIGSLARGGLSNIWGAGVSTYDEEDLAPFPLSLADLAPSYRRVAERIGVTGFADDDLASELDAEIPCGPAMPLAENARRVLQRYERRRARVRAAGVRIGRPRIAVLTEPRGERSGCVQCDMCIWGCHYGAIYSAAHDLRALEAYANLDYRPGTLAEEVVPGAGGYRVRVRTGEGGGTLEAPLLVLAAGGLVTTRLVLQMQRRFDEQVPVVGAPGIGFALCLPERLGSAVAPREFSMGQLSFAVEGDPGRPGDEAYGSLFPASGIPGAMFVERMPLTRPAAVRLFRRLQPALLAGNCFLPGHYSRNTARLVERDGEARLVVQGGGAAELPARLERLRGQIGRAFRRLGAFAIPGSFSPIGPGEEIRYSGTFPMRESAGAGEVDRLGELHGAPGLHLVDLSIFPSMPAKHHTLTLMANADRIGRAIAERWRDR